MGDSYLDDRYYPLVSLELRASGDWRLQVRTEMEVLGCLVSASQEQAARLPLDRLLEVMLGRGSLTDAQRELLLDLSRAFFRELRRVL